MSLHHPQDLIVKNNQVTVESQTIDLIYRFWELFDLENVPWIDSLFAQWNEMDVVIAPAMKPYQEEKLNLALFHHPQLQQFWKESLPKRDYKTLKKIIPESWIIDPEAVSPHTILHAPLVQGAPIWDWTMLAEASQKERELVLKKSGFHEDAWGSRSVVLGHDESKSAWKAAIEEALKNDGNVYSVLQRFHKPSKLSHPVYADAETIYPMEGRVRLCPYYFNTEEALKLGGILASFCPADKKIIHGMSEAAMLPVTVID